MSVMTIDIQKLGRLKKRSEFLFVANRNGKSLYAARSSVVIQARQNLARQNPDRDFGINCGFTATKRVGNAVVRNRCKRRLRACADALLPTLGTPGFDYVFIARNTTHTVAWETLCKDVEKALLRLK